MRDKSHRKVELENEQLALAEKKHDADWKAEKRDLDLERQIYENRKIAAEADLKELTLFQELYNFAARVDKPDELDRLLKLLRGRKNTVGHLITGGKITQDEQIESGERTAARSHP